MRTIEYVTRGAGIALAVVVALLLLGQLLGQPILLGYVASGSMEPEMDTGDGFVAIPDALSGDISEGDVIVFEAREVNEGELTTHRVVAVTDDGYVTKGDANPFTDQDAGEPPVTDGQVVATALDVRGSVVTISHLGTFVMGIGATVESIVDGLASVAGVPGELDGEGAGAMLVAIGVALFGFGILFDRAGPARRETTRSYSRENVIAIWVVIGLVLLVLVTLATAAMVIPSGTTAYDVVSTDSPTDDPQVLAPGETGTLTRTVDNAGYVPVVVRTEAASGGVTVEPSSQTVGWRSQGETLVALSAPESEGQYLRTVSEYRYLAVLPPSLLGSLHDVHPYLAVAAVNGVIVGASVGFVLALFGWADLRVRRPGSHVPSVVRIKRKARNWLR
ncbi:signal peptidase I [Halovivax gelatinilyticus]|uniref:signal peptidase I n=1 Tax=Halovivax gelatinilyticus TaxID=2961597 RepID=UPI0020CA3541|nr:signal peptidase I [Halovivax gelatinilyticus]